MQTQLEAWLLCGNTPSWTDTQSRSDSSFVLRRDSDLVAAAVVFAAAAVGVVEGVVHQAGEPVGVVDLKP